MALVIDLKPQEKLIVGSTIITNDSQRTRLRIDGDAPILREKDTMTEGEATTPSKKLYLSIQNMYLDPADTALRGLDEFFNHVTIIQSLAPHMDSVLNDIAQQILQGTYYKGMKIVQDLMNLEATGAAPQDSSNQRTTEAKTAKVMEAQMLSQSAEQLQQLYDSWDETPAHDRESTISYNRKLWMVFFEGAKTQPQNNGDIFDITANITHLYNYIYKRSAEILESNDREKINTLININHHAAMALRGVSA